MKKAITLFLTLLIMVSFTSCTSSQQPDVSGQPSQEASNASSNPDEVIIINFGTNQPDNHVVAEAYQGLVDELNEKSGGRIKATAYFSEQLGNEKEMVDMTANDINDMFVAAGCSALSVYFPSLQLFDAPYAFSSPQQMLNFANGDDLAFMWDQMAAETNLRVLGTYYFGTRHLTVNDIEVQTPADMAGRKLRVIDAPISLATGRVLGAEPTPLAYSELYLALQQGIIDAQENPVTNILTAKFYEVQNTLVLTGHVTAGVTFTMSEQKWQSIPADLQEIILEATDNAVELASRLIAESEETQISELEALGMKIVQPDLASFKANSASVIEEYSANWIDGLYEIAQNTAA